MEYFTLTYKRISLMRGQCLFMSLPIFGNSHNRDAQVYKGPPHLSCVG